MKLYVEERDMPPNCAECKAEGHYENSYGDEYGFFCPFGYKAYTSGTRDTKRLDNCPLIPVPPHGGLINRDEMFVEFVIEGQKSTRYKVGEKWELNGEEIRRVIQRLPAVIPAEEGE